MPELQALTSVRQPLVITSPVGGHCTLVTEAYNKAADCLCLSLHSYVGWNNSDLHSEGHVVSMQHLRPTCLWQCYRPTYSRQYL